MSSYAWSQHPHHPITSPDSKSCSVFQSVALSFRAALAVEIAACCCRRAMIRAMMWAGGRQISALPRSRNGVG